MNELFLTAFILEQWVCLLITPYQAGNANKGSSLKDHWIVC